MPQLQHLPPETRVARKHPVTRYTTKGIRARMRALLISLDTVLWCFAQAPVTKDGKILPLSDTKFLKTSGFL
jgi:hypothetical protein